jgi:hypothetical protein
MADIDPETASLALVGRFLKQLCELEEKLNEAIAAVLGINDTKRFILCANIGFRNKVHILRSFLHTSNLSDQDKELYDSKLIGIGNLYEKRNTLAHQPFKPAPEGDGVVFSIVHVKSGTMPVETPWKKRDFEAKGAAIEGFISAATELRTALTGSSFTIKRDDMPWLTAARGWWPPTQQQFSPALWNYLSQQTQSAPDLNPDPANQKKDDQTPDIPPK